MNAKKKKHRVFFWGILFLVLTAVFLCGALVFLNNRDFQRNCVSSLLRARGLNVHFENVHIGVLISDKISFCGVTLNFPDGKRVRVEKFLARHNGVRGIFTGMPSFRDFSCEGFSFDDERGRRQLDFSCSADEIGVSFQPWDPIEKYSRGTPLPFLLHAKRFQVRTGGDILAEGNLDGRFYGAEPLTLSGRVRGDLSRLLAQPLFSKINNVAAGAFELTGQGTTAQLVLRDLRSRYGAIEISKLCLLGSRGSGASGTLAIEISGEKTSAMKMSFSSLEFGEGRLRFSGKMEARTLVVADFLRAGLLFRGARSASAVAETSPRVVSEKGGFIEKRTTNKNQKPTHFEKTPFGREKHSRAFWDGVSGTMDFFVKQLIFPQNEMGEHRGRVSVSKKSIEGNYTVPDFYNGFASGSVALAFNPESSLYRLRGALQGNAVEIHNVFPALRSRNQTPIEGKVDFLVSLTAESEMAEMLEEKIVANFKVESFGGGRIRIFNTDSKKIRLAGDIVRIGGNLANMLGGLTRNIEPQVSRFADSTEILRNKLIDFSYLKMSANGEYRAGGDVVCHRFEIFGDALRFNGSGSVRPISGEAPERWPLTLAVESFARGDVADALREFGLIKKSEEAADADGFIPARKFVFSGTPSAVSEHFFETLLDAASGKEVRHLRSPREPAKNPIDAFLFSD